MKNARLKAIMLKVNKEGYGEFKWASGNFYRGEYKNDERDGYGEMLWTDGSWYKGSWIGGIQHGQGVMQLPDGSIKRGLFENNVFIEEISEVDEEKESSMMDPEPATHMYQNNIASAGNSNKKRKKKKKGKRGLVLPALETHLPLTDQSGKHYSSAKKGMIRNSSEPILKRRNKKGLKLDSDKKYSTGSAIVRNKHTISLPKINNYEQDNGMSARLKGFTGAAKNQAAERKKLESYFKSLDKAVQILRDKRQNELINRPWIPAGPVHTFGHRPSSKLG